MYSLISYSVSRHISHRLWNILVCLKEWKRPEHINQSYAKSSGFAYLLGDLQDICSIFTWLIMIKTIDVPNHSILKFVTNGRYCLRRSKPSIIRSQDDHPCLRCLPSQLPAAGCFRFLINQHIEAETKWPPFCRQHFQWIFLNWTCMNFD